MGLDFLDFVLGCVAKGKVLLFRNRNRLFQRLGE
jgi:hypothetical protein